MYRFFLILSLHTFYNTALFLFPFLCSYLTFSKRLQMLETKFTLLIAYNMTFLKTILASVCRPFF